MYERILLAADGSVNSVRAAEEAAKIALFAAESVVEIVYVTDLSKVKSEVLHAQSQEELRMKREQKLTPHKEVLAAKNVKHKMTFLKGDPGPTIVEYANKEKVDLLVIGSRGLNAFQEFMLGSVSHKVVKRVKCPVLVVK